MSSVKKNIVLIGMPGCGKTTIGRKLAKKIGVKFYDSDNYIEVTTGKSIPEIFQNGEDSFRQLETETIRKLAQETPCVISTGGGVVKKVENIEALKENGIIIFINRPIENIVKNINIKKRPLLKDKKETLYKLYDERIDLYKRYCDYEITNNSSIYSAVNKIEFIINSNRKEIGM
ncbi:shikimate kinase [Proteiniborus sp. DW1]|uniref:shikimate kinase n=1 Tax=Proteiniborus sp. DW1 TaxID=1889883 RepID=UPI00092DF28C|nr:shikimate kinase [Proteiniborus sp. DW1]SCG83137.1 shikimate kinase [Proteiniborus sp. DW1]